MKVICENWKTCKNEDCNFHRNPHVHGATCDDPCEKDNGIKGSKCIPVQEIKYKTEGSGYCLTECEYIDDIKIGSIGCKDCKHCVERDPFNKIVTCTHPKEDKVELYICDKAGDNESCNHCTNRIPQSLETIKSISGLYINPNQNFCALRNIPVKAIPYKNEEKKMEKQEYRSKVGNISMMSMGQKINCGDFRLACKTWLDMGYNITSDIAFDKLILVAKGYIGGIQCLIDKGFIEKVKPELDYNKPIVAESSSGNKYLLVEYHYYWTWIDIKTWQFASEEIECKEKTTLIDISRKEGFKIYNASIEVKKIS